MRYSRHCKVRLALRSHQRQPHLTNRLSNLRWRGVSPKPDSPLPRIMLPVVAPTGSATILSIKRVIHPAPRPRRRRSRVNPCRIKVRVKPAGVGRGRLALRAPASPARPGLRACRRLSLRSNPPAALAGPRWQKGQKQPSHPPASSSTSIVGSRPHRPNLIPPRDHQTQP